MPSVLLSNWKILLHESVMRRHSQNHTPVIIENKQMHVTVYIVQAVCNHIKKRVSVVFVSVIVGGVCQW